MTSDTRMSVDHTAFQKAKGKVPDIAGESGLTGDGARRRLEKFGPNTMPDTAPDPLRRAVEKFWAPVPWMLEATIVLELVLGKFIDRVARSAVSFAYVATHARDLEKTPAVQPDRTAIRAKH
jgi:hypothetical protein